MPSQEVGISYNDPSSRREWTIDGSRSRDVIVAVAALIVPAIDIIGGVARFYERHEIKEKGGGIWTASASYRSKPTYKELSITTTGATAKMLQSLKTTRGYNTRATALNEDALQWQLAGEIADFKKAIGVHGATIDGVDITVPKFDFTIAYKFQLSSLSASYLMTVYKMTGTANDAPYTIIIDGQTVTFSAGDLRFLGFTYKKTSDGQLDTTFNFSPSKGLAGGAITTAGFIQPPLNGTVDVHVHTVSDFTVGGSVRILRDRNDGAGLKTVGLYSVVTITPLYRVALKLTESDQVAPGFYAERGVIVSADIDDMNPLMIGESGPIKKKGWEYLWTSYEESEDLATRTKTKAPVAVYVEKVIGYTNFDNLGII